MSGIVIAVLIIAAIAVVVGLVYALYDGEDVTVPDRKDVLDFIRNVPLAILVLAIVGGVIYGVGCLMDLVGWGAIVVLALPVVPLIIWGVREDDLKELAGILGIIWAVTCGIILFLALVGWIWDVDSLVMIFGITFFILSAGVSFLCMVAASIQMGINQKYAGYSAPSGFDDDLDEMIREQLVFEICDLLPERWTAMPNHERFLQRCYSLTSADGAATIARICLDTRKEHFLISIAKHGELADIHSIECSGVLFERHAGSHWFCTKDGDFISQLFNEENPTCTLTIKTDDGTTYETTFNNPLFREQPKELDAAAPEQTDPTPDAE